MNYDNIIAYENEHSGLDFKSVQYEKKTHAAFLKDIVALANADVEGTRLIIIGIKHKPNSQREIVPISKDDFVDQATYQQLVRENIEPELMITYDPYEYKGSLIGIIRLSDCSKRPYMLKKDFSTLKKGDCFIRRGSHQVRALRSDFDRFYESRENGAQFYGNVSIGFSGSNYSDEIKLSTIGQIDLPSVKAAKEIKEILAEKKNKKNC
jgi:predicted HTH transcriptional regulator